MYKIKFKRKILFTIFIIFIISLLFLQIQYLSITKAEEVEIYESLNGSTVTENDDGGVCCTTLSSQSDPWIEESYLKYNIALDVTKPIIINLDPFNAAYSTVNIYSDESRETLHYNFVICRQSEDLVNVRTRGGFWNNKASIGMDKYKVVIDEQQTSLYINETLIENYSLCRADFDSGKAYLQFGGVYYWTADDAIFNVRIGDPEIIDSSKFFTLKQTTDLIYSVNLKGANVNNLLISEAQEGGVYSIVDSNKYTWTDESLSIRAQNVKDIVNNNTGLYNLKLKTAAGDLVLLLDVGNNEEIKIVDQNIQYDLFADDGENLKINLRINTDNFDYISGNEITEQNYSYTNETLTINSDYLVNLSCGDNTFTLFSDLNQQGSSFIINIIETTPPEYDGDNVIFDANNPLDAEFLITMYQNNFVSLTGNDITENDYLFENSTLKINSQYLSTLIPNNNYDFNLEADFGNINLTTEIINSNPAILIGNNEFTINIQNTIDAAFEFDMKYDFFESITGNNITENDYYYNNEIVYIKGSYIEQLQNTELYTFTINTRYGQTDVNVNIIDVQPPVLISANVANFEKNISSAPVFTIQTNNSILNNVYGYEITSNDFTFDIITGELTINEQYLRSLQNGEKQFRIEFDMGNIFITVNITNTENPVFENQKNYIVDGISSFNDDYSIYINAQNGVFNNVQGNGITEENYSYDLQSGLLIIKKEFLATFSEQMEENFTVNFDNGNVKINLSIPYTIDNTKLYIYDKDGVNVANSEQGAIDVSYTPIKGSGIMGGILRADYNFDINNPITVYTNFTKTTNQLGYNFAISVSSDDYKTFFNTDTTDGNNESELYAAFGVTEQFFTTTTAGVCSLNSSMQIPHDLMRRNTSGFDAFTFDIGDDTTKIYFNDRLISTVPTVTKSNFTNEKAYVMFCTVTYIDENSQTEPEEIEFLYKVNGDIKADTNTQIYNTNIENDIEFIADCNNSFITDICLVENDIETSLYGYKTIYNSPGGIVNIVFEADSIINSPYFTETGIYNIRVKNSSGYVDYQLKISDKREIEINQVGYTQYDIYEPADLEISLLENIDTFNSLSGNNITANDYTYSNNILTINQSYLSSLEKGQYTFNIISELESEGVSFILYVINSTPPAVIGEDFKDFDIQNGTDIIFTVDVKNGQFVNIEGNDITQSDYIYDNDTNTITFKREYITDLDFGMNNFTIKVGYNTDKFNTLVLSIDVINSLSATFNDGSTSNNITVYKDDLKDIVIKIKTNQGQFSGVQGAYINKDYYTFNQDTSELTLKKEWINTLIEGTYKLTVFNTNGKLKLNMTIETTKPVEETKPGCGGNLYSEVGLFGISLCFLYVALTMRNRRKDDEK